MLKDGKKVKQKLAEYKKVTYKLYTKVVWF